MEKELLEALESVWQLAWDGLENMREDEKFKLDQAKIVIKKAKEHLTTAST